MSQTTETLLIVFTGLTTLAFVTQGIALVVISRKMRELTARVDAVSTKLTKQIDSLAVQADNFLSMLNSAAEKIHGVQENVAAISAVVHHRVVEVDAFLNEATDVARLQMARFQDVIETASHRIDETLDTLQNAVVVPIMEVHAVIRGIRSGLDVLFGWRKRSSQRSHNDEEMFI